MDAHPGIVLEQAAGHELLLPQGGRGRASRAEEMRERDGRFEVRSPGLAVEVAGSYEADIVEGRFVIETRHGRKRWQVIVEPDAVAERLVVVTAYAAGR